MLLAARLVGGDVDMTRRNLGCRFERCLGSALLRTDIGGHRKLLEQQTEQRKQRNPAVATVTQRHRFIQ